MEVPMKVTSAQIARELGISRSTVSRALNGYPHVDESVRQQVLALADKMEYHPNLAARCLAKGEHLLVGVVLYAKADSDSFLREYMEDLLRGVELARRQLSDYGLHVETVVTDITRPEEQIEALNALAAKGAKGIAIAPCDPDVVAPTLDKLMNDGVQILLLNTDVPQSQRLCYVGSDYIQAGRICAELVGGYLQGKGSVATIIFDDRGTMTSQKLTGFREEIGHYSGIEMLGPYKFPRTGERVYENTCSLIQERQPDAIFMTYGELESVAQAVEDCGMAEKIRLVGFDCSRGILSYLGKRVISAVVYQDPAVQGMVSIKILHEFLTRNIRPRSSLVHARLEIVTHQNRAYYQRDSLNVSTYYYL